jgi:hypothetical protein
VTVREESAIEDEDPTYFRAALADAPLQTLKPALQVLQDDKGSKTTREEKSKATSVVD